MIPKRLYERQSDLAIRNMFPVEINVAAIQDIRAAAEVGSPGALAAIISLCDRILASPNQPWATMTEAELAILAETVND